MEKKIEIWYDQDASNPFEDWDCEPELIYYSGGRHGSTTDCSGGNIVEEIKRKATTGLVKRHIKTIFHDILETDPNYFETFDERYNYVMDEIGSATVKDLAKFCELFKIPHSYHNSTGYSQGDWAEVLLVCTDEFFETTGCERKNAEEILKGARELFDAWIWGDVFGFTEYTRKDYVKIPREEYAKGSFENVQEEVEWEQTDSCGGFYGDNFENNGMLDYVSEELKEVVKNFDKSKVLYK